MYYYYICVIYYVTSVRRLLITILYYYTVNNIARLHDQKTQFVSSKPRGTVGGTKVYLYDIGSRSLSCSIRAYLYGYI